jgi:hypothetical protein
MRIRTDGDYDHREDVIDRAAAYYDCNKTSAVLAACEDVPGLVDALEEVLAREDLTLAQRREIASTFSSRSRAVDVDVELVVDIERDP